MSIPLPLLQRLSALILLYIVELVAISVWLDDAALAGQGGVIGFVHDWGAWILRSIVGFAGLFVTCAFLKNQALLDRISQGLEGLRIRLDFLSLHLAALALFGLLSIELYAGALHRDGVSANALEIAWFAAGLSAIAFGAISLVPWNSWRLLVGGTGYLWFYVLVAVLGACAGGYAIRFLWVPAARGTFVLVDLILKPFLSGIQADPGKMSIGTSRFSVEIAKECSGLEGIGLILAFTGLWLLLFRKDFRFPNALAIIPAGVVIMFALNAVRIASLVAIGNAGAERIAVGGFHSQAGWIAFNALALGIAVGARKVPWIRAVKSVGSPEARENFAAIFLGPFLVILAAGMLCTAVSAGFEWFYPVRFFAAAGALWHFRKHYLKLHWRATWFGPTVGVAAFVLWIAFDRSSNLGMPAALSASPVFARNGWITFRVLAAVVTVPLAEELAFRGYLFRALMAEDRRFTWPAFVISSVLFGLLHGDRWMAGTLAGALYAIALVRRGRIADAVTAHATTNAMLAGYVLLVGKWQYW